jgi:hypothetical protein
MHTESREKGELSRPSSDSPGVAPESGIAARMFSFPGVLACSLTYLVYLFSRRNIADPDLWWHLRNAQHLFTTGHLPVVDSYSFTAPGAAVMPFEWLSELPYYLAYKLAGLSGVFWLVFLLVSAIVLGIFRLSYLASDDVKNSFVVSVAGAVLAAVSIGARTLLFGWLYLVMLLLILDAVRNGKRRWLWLVPPLFCLWVNSHGSWPLGMVVFGIFIASGLVEGTWGNAYATRWLSPQLRSLFITAAASVAAVFINPSGYRLVLYPFKVMQGVGSGPGGITEFASIDFQTPWGKVAMVLILGTLLIAIFSRERWRLDEVAYMVVTLYYSLTYVRFMFLAAILAAPIFAKRLKLMTPYDGGSDNRRHNAVALAILFSLFIISTPRGGRFQSTVDYPEGAVAYMQANGIHGKVLHDWAWGGYLIWHMPELKVFIDGRGDPYGPTGVFADYLAAISNENAQAVLDKYQVEYVLMPVQSPLAMELKRDPLWIVQYSDKTSVLLHHSSHSEALFLGRHD